ncbi:MAG: hypothetical protein J0I32_05805 [Sphingobacteriales bacterium]|nr:hypothetical protein [Sphingobacteriales bacterium]OJW03916.1 MAG: hypothetical protein BGO52_17355 [Sphingobacteriales bacterium 44-61]
MKKKIILPVFAVIATLAIAISMSAFTGKSHPADVAKKEVVTKYFRYSGPNNEADYKNPIYWAPLAAPGGTDPCPGNDFVCIMQTEDVPSGLVNDLVTYLSNTTVVPSAKAYCNDGTHVIYEQE